MLQYTKHFREMENTFSDKGTQVIVSSAEL